MKPEPRILFVSSTLGRGGAERVLTELGRYLLQQGMQVTIVTVSDAADSAYELDPGIHRISLGPALRGAPLLSQAVALFQRGIKLRKLVRDLQPDCVISFIDLMNIFTLLSLGGTKIPVLVSERVYPDKSFLLEDNKPRLLRACVRPLRKFLYRKAQKIILLTEAGRSCFPEKLHAKIEIIPNPIFPAPTVTPDTKLPPKSIVGMGRLVAQKRFDVLIRAFGKIYSSFPDWSLHIFGAGPLRGELEKLSQEQRCGQQIIFHGVTLTPEAVLAQAQIFVLSSDYEGFPNVLAQALQAGVACIASDCLTGPREMIQQGVNGLLFSPGDVEALNSLLLDCMQNEVKRAGYGEKGRYIAQIFNPVEIFALWKDCICHAMSKR